MLERFNYWVYCGFDFAGNRSVLSFRDGILTFFLDRVAMFLLAKMLSGLYPCFHRPLLKDAGNLALKIRERPFTSAHSSIFSPSSLVSLYTQFVLWLLKSPIIIFVLLSLKLCGFVKMKSAPGEFIHQRYHDLSQVSCKNFYVIGTAYEDRFYLGVIVHKKGTSILFVRPFDDEICLLC